MLPLVIELLWPKGLWGLYTLHHNIPRQPLSKSCAKLTPNGNDKHWTRNFPPALPRQRPRNFSPSYTTNTHEFTVTTSKSSGTSTTSFGFSVVFTSCDVSSEASDSSSESTSTDSFFVFHLLFFKLFLGFHGFSRRIDLLQQS